MAMVPDDSMQERSALRHALGLFPATILTGRFLVLLVACEASVGGIGTYVANSGSRSALAQSGFTVAAITGAAALAFALTFMALWVVAPGQIRDERMTVISSNVAWLMGRVEQLGGTAPGAERLERLRVALFAVRSELGACAERIGEARERGKWWDPATDPLPSQKWSEHFADLSDPRLPDALNAQIDVTYKRCDRLNHRSREYMEAQKRSQVFPLLPQVGPLPLQPADRELLTDSLSKVNDTNRAISDYLKGDQP